MTNDQINHAISQLYGWSANYCTDLNAMHEAEEVLGSEALFEAYYLKLYDVTHSTLWPIRATARQRAEAFLKTLGKWEEPVVKDSLTTDGDLLRDVTKMVVEATTEQSSADHLRDATKKVGEVQP